MKAIKTALAALAMAVGLTQVATAGDYDGNFMVRLQGAYVVSNDDVRSLHSSALGDLKALGFDAEVSDQLIPAATLTYFLNKNLSLELLCCFSKHSVDLKSPIPALAGNIAETWIFPPAVTLQYHVTGLGAIKPYVGLGAQYIHFFNEKVGDNTIAADSVNFKDGFGVVLQAGVDIAMGGGWYLNADIKKTFLDTTVTWRNSVAGDVTAKVDLDPLIVSAGIGYRFNLEDIFGHRRSYDALK